MPTADGIAPPQRDGEHQAMNTKLVASLARAGLVASGDPAGTAAAVNQVAG